MGWHGYRTRLGDWFWSRTLPNGWNAVVGDQTQSSAPPQPTRYTASACCCHWIRQMHDTFASLEQAKAEALKHAMSQPDDCTGPGSNYHYESKGV